MLFIIFNNVFLASLFAIIKIKNKGVEEYEKVFFIVSSYFIMLLFCGF